MTGAEINLYKQEVILPQDYSPCNYQFKTVIKEAKLPDEWHEKPNYNRIEFTCDDRDGQRLCVANVMFYCYAVFSEKKSVCLN